MTRSNGHYDVVVIGAGAGGEAAGSLGAEIGGRVAVVERDLVGGECTFWACMPSKTLLSSAAQRAFGAPYPWSRASERRDWMISREGTDYPDDASRVAALEQAGAELIRGTARVVAADRVEVDVGGEGGRPRTLWTRSLVVASGSVPFVPPIDGLAEAGYWTSRDATASREVPSSIVVLGGGPIGVEMSQVFVRFGSRVTMVEGNDRILPRDHPRSSAVVAEQLRLEGVDVRVGVTATAVRRGGAGRVVELSDGSTAEGAHLLVAVGRRPADLRALGLEEAGVRMDERGRVAPDERMAIGDRVFVAGDAAQGLQFTHLADYEGRVAVRAALGQDGTANLDVVPRVTFTDPEVGAVGLTEEQARERGIDAVEVSADFATTARGLSLEQVGRDLRDGAPGHVSAVVDRGRGTLAGAFAAAPGAGEFIHMAVVAMRASVPVAVLADTITAFPAGARVFGNLMAEAAKRLR